MKRLITSSILSGFIIQILYFLYLVSDELKGINLNFIEKFLFFTDFYTYFHSFTFDILFFILGLITFITIQLVFKSGLRTKFKVMIIPLIPIITFFFLNLVNKNIELLFESGSYYFDTRFVPMDKNIKIDSLNYRNYTLRSMGHSYHEYYISHELKFVNDSIITISSEEYKVVDTFPLKYLLNRYKFNTHFCRKDHYLLKDNYIYMIDSTYYKERSYPQDRSFHNHKFRYSDGAVLIFLPWSNSSNNDSISYQLAHTDEIRVNLNEKDLRSKDLYSIGVYIEICEKEKTKTIMIDGNDSDGVINQFEYSLKKRKKLQSNQINKVNSCSNKLLKYAKYTDKIYPPKKGYTTVYLLTNKGRYYIRKKSSEPTVDPMKELIKECFILYNYIEYEEGK